MSNETEVWIHTSAKATVVDGKVVGVAAPDIERAQHILDASKRTVVFSRQTVFRMESRDMKGRALDVRTHEELGALFLDSDIDVKQMAEVVAEFAGGADDVTVDVTP